ncbi:MAG TPA: ABC transporter permease [Clostridia bacterium]|nr:ABC transporter permease [Clostridia bacterium]
MRINDWLVKGAQNEEHGQYLKALRLEQLKVLATQISLLILLLVFWEVGANRGMIDTFIFSQPSRIWELILEKAADGSLYRHTWVTVLETVVGFCLGTLLGTLLAIVIWASPFLARVLDPYLVVLNSMPKVALGPFFIVTLGTGFLPIVAIAVAISGIITTIVVYSSFQEVDANYLKLTQTLGATRWQSFYKVVLPASIPSIISTLKVNVGLSWVGVIVGEFLVAKAGLGYLIIYGFQVFNLTLVMTSLLIISLLATFMYQAVAFLEKKLLQGRH